MIHKVFLLLIYSPLAFCIINGKEITSYERVPLSSSTVALQLKYFKDDGSVGYRKGTGILIGDEIVLTAGHNIFYQEKPEDIEVIFHERPCWGVNICDEERIFVKEKVIHPDFRNDFPNPPQNDIAILKLSHKAPLSFHPIAISDDTIKEGPFYLYGFGQSKYTGSIPPPLSDFILREFVYSFPQEVKLGQSSEIVLSQSEGGFCAGDSGAALISCGGGSQTIIGIVSHLASGMDCSSDGYFTDLKYFRKWILNTIRLKSWR